MVRTQQLLCLNSALLRRSSLPLKLLSLMLESLMMSIPLRYELIPSSSDCLRTLVCQANRGVKRLSQLFSIMTQLRGTLHETGNASKVCSEVGKMSTLAAKLL